MFGQGVDGTSFYWDRFWRQHFSVSTVEETEQVLGPCLIYSYVLLSLAIEVTQGIPLHHQIQRDAQTYP